MFDPMKRTSKRSIRVNTITHVIVILLLCPGLSGANAINAERHRAPEQAKSELVRGSRNAIIAGGFSENYFDSHFKLVDVHDRPGDLRVTWRFSLNGYETLVTDAVGYYTDARGRKILVHSVANTLQSTNDIVKTIRKSRAEELMKECIGKFMNESVVFMKVNAGDKTSLFLMAYAVPRSKNEKREREVEGRSNANRTNSRGLDEVPQEGGEHESPIVIGYINAETGKCSKGEATVTP